MAAKWTAPCTHPVRNAAPRSRSVSSPSRWAKGPTAPTAKDPRIYVTVHRWATATMSLNVARDPLRRIWGERMRVAGAELTSSLEATFSRSKDGVGNLLCLSVHPWFHIRMRKCSSRSDEWVRNWAVPCLSWNWVGLACLALSWFELSWLSLPWLELSWLVELSWLSLNWAVLA